LAVCDKPQLREKIFYSRFVKLRKNRPDQRLRSFIIKRFVKALIEQIAPACAAYQDLLANLRHALNYRDFNAAASRADCSDDPGGTGTDYKNGSLLFMHG
jgi:hypothetical protein